MPDVAVVKGARALDAEDLDIGYTHKAETSHGSSAPDTPELRADDPLIQKVLRPLRKFRGVILTGPPGTSKSWLASQVATKVTDGDNSRRADIQFHPSYQFEDFMEGYRPKKDGSGFEPRLGVFLRLAEEASKNPDQDYAIVIDELSRADVGRVFGEALTYIERSKRGQTFNLPSGEQCSIPINLYMIATMNPLDRGVDEVDAAFERRFAKVDMPPSREVLNDRLARNDFPDRDVRRRLLAWFDKINARAAQTPTAAVGHAYFMDVVDAETLHDVWEYQLKYHVDRAFKYDPDTHAEVVTGWKRIFGESANDIGEQDSESP